MKVILLALLILGAALAADLRRHEDIPEFRDMHKEPLVAPQPDEPALRIINGQEVVPHTIPYQAFLLASSPSGSWSCGGSLLTKRWVLTAAHCIEGASSVSVLLGAHNIKNVEAGSVRINSKRLIVHERYDEQTIDNDIGLIELDGDVEPSRTIAYTRLPSIRDVGQNLVGQVARVSGWGLTRTGIFQATSDVLMSTTNTIIDNRSCNQTFGIVRNEEICMAGTNRQSACRGDSGGPLVLPSGVQIGVVSYGTGQCAINMPSVYARVTSFINWIQQHSDWRAS